MLEVEELSCELYTYSSMPNVTVTPTATILSSTQKPQPTHIAHSPHLETQCATQRFTNVAKPIGIVPRNNEFVGSCIMTTQISGHIVYRRTETVNAEKKRIVFRMKNAMER